MKNVCLLVITTCDVRVSKDVVLDEITSWYFEVKDTNGVDVNETMVTRALSHFCVLILVV